MRHAILNTAVLKKIKRRLFSAIGLSMPLHAHALPSADQVFIHFSQNAEILVGLVQATAVLTGFVFVFKAFLKLKIYGEMRSMMAPHARLNQIILLIFAGTLLISVPYATRDILMDAFFGSPTIKELVYHPDQHFSSEMIYAAKRLVRLIGYVAFVRGIVQLGTYQEGGRHTIGKPMTHIAAGIFAINIEQTRKLLGGLFLDIN